MGEKFQLTKIFNDVCVNVSRIPEKRFMGPLEAIIEEEKNVNNDFLKNYGSKMNKAFYVPETEEFESLLEEYILNTMGYHIYNLYKDYKTGRRNVFEYFPEVRKYFENAIVNFKIDKFTTIDEWVRDYGEEFHKYIEGFPYVDKLIKAIEKIYCGNNYDVVVSHNHRNFMIYHPCDKNEEELPMVCIQDIDRLNKIIADYIEAVKTTDNFYKNVFEESHCLSESEAIEEILGWTLRNASQFDLSNVELFFTKYLNYIIDNTFDAYGNRVVPVGKLFEDEHYIVKRKAALAYETPYYLRFMLRNSVFEFPNIRYGIEWTNGEKVAHIQAIQSSQEITPTILHNKISKYINSSLPKRKNFREFNPLHLASLVEFIGMLNAFGIKKVVACDYFALRYQRYCLENQMSEEELHNYQHRLTNKYINTFFRLFEYTDDIKLLKYPDETGELIFSIGEDVKFDAPILQKLYDIGYQSAKEQGIGQINSDIQNRFAEYYQSEAKTDEQLKKGLLL